MVLGSIIPTLSVVASLTKSDVRRALLDLFLCGRGANRTTQVVPSDNGASADGSHGEDDKITGMEPSSSVDLSTGTHKLGSVDEISTAQQPSTSARESSNEHVECLDFSERPEDSVHGNA
jgi:hypothetical protein